MPYSEPVKAPPCHKCHGACCRQETGWTYACWLSPEDLQVPSIRSKAVRRKVDDAWVLPYRGGKCVFLDGHTNQCKIYHERPTVCQTFNCRECNEFNQFIARNPLVKAILKENR